MSKKQAELDGFGRKADKALDALCQAYLDSRDKRKKAEKAEAKARKAYISPPRVRTAAATCTRTGKWSGCSRPRRG